MSKEVVVTILVLCCCVGMSASADDWNVDYPEDAAWLPCDAQMCNIINRNMTMADVDRIVEEKVAATNQDIKNNVISTLLDGDKLKSLIKGVQKKEMDKIRDCRSQNYTYWDDGIPECRSCLMPRCQEHEPCRRECRDILKIRKLENDTAAAQEEKVKIRECRSQNYTYWDDEIHKCRNCFMSECHEHEPCRRECRDILKIHELQKEVAAGQKERKEQKADISSGQDTDESLWKWIVGLIVAFFVLCVWSAAIVFYLWAKNLPGIPMQVNEVGQDAGQGRGRETVWQKAFRHIFCRRNVNKGSESIALPNRTEGPAEERTFQDQGQSLLNENATPA